MFGKLLNFRLVYEKMAASVFSFVLDLALVEGSAWRLVAKISLSSFSCRVFPDIYFSELGIRKEFMNKHMWFIGIIYPDIYSSELGILLFSELV